MTRGAATAARSWEREPQCLRKPTRRSRAFEPRCLRWEKGGREQCMCDQENEGEEQREEDEGGRVARAAQMKMRTDEEQGEAGRPRTRRRIVFRRWQPRPERSACITKVPGRPLLRPAVAPLITAARGAHATFHPASSAPFRPLLRPAPGVLSLLLCRLLCRFLLPQRFPSVAFRLHLSSASCTGSLATSSRSWP